MRIDKLNTYLGKVCMHIMGVKVTSVRVTYCLSACSLCDQSAVGGCVLLVKLN